MIWMSPERPGMIPCQVRSRTSCVLSAQVCFVSVVAETGPPDPVGETGEPGATVEEPVAGPEDEDGCR